ncbi:MAG: hypothetical protein FJ320_09705 [SAR202 cluster bacterium]|nr:hypothetical protein [SAR202 cluster bacterium]
MVKSPHAQKAARHKLVEVGLHLEDQPPVNKHYLAHLSDHASALRDTCPTLEAEQWTDSWTRLHQSLTLTTLNEDLLMEVANATSRMITTLEPMVRRITPP